VIAPELAFTEVDMLVDDLFCVRESDGNDDIEINAPEEFDAA
jgi:hypothetical protein